MGYSVDEPKQSDWNTAGFTNYRFHEIKKLAHEARFADDYKGWIKALFAFYSELHPQLKEKDRKRVQQALKEARTELKSGMGAISKEDLHDKLFQVELSLEEEFDKHGNKFSYKQDGSTALGRI